IKIHPDDQMLLHSLYHHRDANASVSQYYNVALQQYNAAQQILRAVRCFCRRNTNFLRKAFYSGHSARMPISIRLSTAQPMSVKITLPQPLHKTAEQLGATSAFRAAWPMSRIS